MRLYRPVGLKELMLIIESGWKSFPPRLVWQPIFYPVMNEDYATQIAAEWNAGDAFSGYCGAVLAFEIEDGYVTRYDVHHVGGALHNELWIPAEELEDFNKNMIGTIEIVKVFLGNQFRMPDDPETKTVLLKWKQS